jgi:hypothetical protein
MAREIQLTKSLHFSIYAIIMVLLIVLAVFLYSFSNSEVDAAGMATDTMGKNLAGKAIGGFECLSNQDCTGGKKCMGGFCEGTNPDDYVPANNDETDDLSGQAVDSFTDLSCITNDDCFPDEQCVDEMCVFVGEVCVPECSNNQECIDGMCFDIEEDFYDSDSVSANGDINYNGYNNLNDDENGYDTTQNLQNYNQPNQQINQLNQQLNQQETNQQQVSDVTKQQIGGSCSSTNDCLNSVCDSNSGKCVGCYEDENCAIIEYCDLMAKECKEGCRSNYDCLTNERCVNGGCVFDPNTKQIPKQGAFAGEATKPKAETLSAAESSKGGEEISSVTATGSISKKNDDDNGLGRMAWAAIIFVTVGMFTAMVVVMHNHEKKHAQSINSPNTTQQQVQQQSEQLPQQEQAQQYQNQQPPQNSPQEQTNQQYQAQQVQQQSEPEINAPDFVQEPLQQAPQQQYQQKNVIDSETDKQFLKYAKSLLDQGMNKDEAVQQLTNSGWNKDILEKLFTQHASLLISTSERQQIENYIRYYVKKGLQKESIKQGLTNAGWDMGVIDDIMQEF